MRRLAPLLIVLALACDEPAAAPAAPPTPSPATPAPAPVAPPELSALAATTSGEAVLAAPPSYERETWRAFFGSDDARGLVVIAKDESETTPKVRLVLFGAPRVGTYPVVLEAARRNREGVVTVALDHQPTLRVLGGEVVIASVDDATLAGTIDLEVRDAMTPSQLSRVRASFQAQHDRFYDAQLDHERAIREQLKRR
jgi:hypothetical protein